MQHTSTYQRGIRYGIAVATGFLLFPIMRLQAQRKHQGHPAKKHTVHRNVKSNDKPVKRHYRHHTAHHATKHHYTHRQNAGRHKRNRHYRYRYTHHRRHWPLVRMQPGRVKEIQQALARTGYLQEAPTGRWDAATRDAMRRYQQANGFSPTGLPEAKPLMKLGLGPHPLPPGLEPLRPVSGDTTGTTEASTSPSTISPGKAASQAQ